METTIRINTDALGPDVLNSIKALFPHKMVEIIVHSADETEYISDNPSFSRELKRRIDEYEAGRETIGVNPDDLI